MKNLVRSFSVFLLLGFPLSLSAIIIHAEYFIGNDPGSGLGISIPLSDTQSLGSGLSQATAALNGLPPGTYTVGVRVKDDLNRWSNPSLRRFTVQSSTVIAATTSLVESSADAGSSSSDTIISQAEYFVGNDPGEGNGTAIPLSDTQSLGSVLSQATAALNGLPPGTYTVGVRVKDGLNRWSNPSLRRFTVQSSTVIAETTSLVESSADAGASSSDTIISQAEYFVGNDPGEGNGTAISLADAQSLGSGLSQAHTALNGLPPGTYTVGVRVKDDLNRWSNPSLRRFTVQSSTVIAATTSLVESSADAGSSSSDTIISQAEYFVGNDPGEGNGSAIALADAQSLGSGLSQAHAALNGLPPGTYTVGVRVKDGLNRWSNPSLRRVTLQSSALVAETTASVEANHTDLNSQSLFSVWSLSLGTLQAEQVNLLVGDQLLSYRRLKGENNDSFIRRIRGLMMGNPFITSRFTIGSVSSNAFTLTAKELGSSTHLPLSSENLLVTKIANGRIGAGDGKITAAEYFWNVDPGVGLGFPLAITSSGPEATFSSQSVPITNFTGGNHRLGIRFKNQAGRWSNPIYRGISSFVLFGEQDTSPPVLSLIGSSLVSIDQGAAFIDPGIQATDIVDGDISSRVVVTVGLDSSIAGLQTIEYTVSDRAGNISKIQRQVEVKPATPNLDYNINGMPDWWEELHFENLSQSSLADVDNDGTSNQLEYLAGTDPKNSNSVFRPHGQLEGVNYSMPISTIEGRSYKVWASRDLNQWVLRQTIAGDGTIKNFVFKQNEITSGPLHAPDEAARYFFRVEVSEP